MNICKKIVFFVVVIVCEIIFVVVFGVLTSERVVKFKDGRFVVFLYVFDVE